MTAAFLLLGPTAITDIPLPLGPSCITDLTLLLLLLLLSSAEDERFLVKTMRKSEMNVLLEMLPAYHDHVMQHPHTLITRFFGLHRVKPLHGSAVSRAALAGWKLWTLSVATVCKQMHLFWQAKQLQAKQLFMCVHNNFSFGCV
jgi:hypothetical protein